MESTANSRSSFSKPKCLASSASASAMPASHWAAAFASINVFTIIVVSAMVSFCCREVVRLRRCFGRSSSTDDHNEDLTTTRRTQLLMSMEVQMSTISLFACAHPYPCTRASVPSTRNKIIQQHTNAQKKPSEKNGPHCSFAHLRTCAPAKEITA